MNRKRRKELLKSYHFLYRINRAYDIEECAYCGEYRTSFDHVPPITICPSLNIKKYKEDGGKFYLYPSCSRCNKFLCNNANTAYQDRIQILIRKYTKALNKIAKYEEEEIEELGYNLRILAKNNIHRRAEVIKKLNVLNQRYADIENINLLE